MVFVFSTISTLSTISSYHIFQVLSFRNFLNLAVSASHHLPLFPRYHHISKLKMVCPRFYSFGVSPLIYCRGRSQKSGLSQYYSSKPVNRGRGTSPSIYKIFQRLFFKGAQKFSIPVLRSAVLILRSFASSFCRDRIAFSLAL